MKLVKLEFRLWFEWDCCPVGSLKVTSCSHSRKEDEEALKHMAENYYKCELTWLL